MESENKIDKFINAGTYEDACDFSIIPPEGKYVTEELLSKNARIFCKTDYIPYLFEMIKNSDREYALVTHHSDYSIDSRIFSMKPKCIKKWFAINPTHRDESLIAIPLGLKTHKGIYLEEKYMTSWFAENADSLRSNQKEEIVYCNWTSTNPYRNSVISDLDSASIRYKLESGLTFDKYAENMSRCRYVISPPGNGIDCHRTWEALYIGCIPIVIKNPIYDEWPGLPILQVDEYSQLSKEILEEFSTRNFDMRMIEMSYWRDKINNSI